MAYNSKDRNFLSLFFLFVLTFANVRVLDSQA